MGKSADYKRKVKMENRMGDRGMRPESAVWMDEGQVGGA